MGIAQAVREAWIACARWEARPADGREWTHLALPRVREEGERLHAVEILTRHGARALGAEIGADLEEEAAAAADGRLRLLAVIEGSRLVAAFAAEPDGTLRTLHPQGRDPDPAAFAAAARLAHCLDREGQPVP